MNLDLYPFLDSFSNIRRGINAKKINGKKPVDGQDNAKSNPLNKAKNSFLIEVTNIIIFLSI